MGKYTALFLAMLGGLGLVVIVIVMSGKKPGDTNRHTDKPARDTVLEDKETGFGGPMTFEDIQDAPRGGTFTVGMQQEPESLHVLFASMAASTEVLGCLSRSMVEMNADWKYYPVLVKEMPTRENGLVELWDYPGEKNEKGEWKEDCAPAKGLKVTWNFHEGLKWADGHPMGPEDVRFAFEVIMHASVPVVSRDLERRVLKMEIPEGKPNTLVVHWKQTYANYFLGHTILPKHILEKEFREAPEKMDKSEYGRNPLSNGPYVLTEWKAGSHIIMDRNANYSPALGTAPLLDRVIYRFIGDTNTLRTNLVTGEIQAISPTGTAFDEALQFKREHGDKFSLSIANGMVWEHVDMNLDNEILKDKRVRQALLHGIDREFICQQLFEGKQQPAHSWLPPKHYAYAGDLPKYACDARRAGELLDEAGWKLGGKGVREKDGQPLRLTLQTTAGNKLREKVQQYIQSDLSKIGVEIVIDNQPANVFFDETMKKRKYKHMGMYAWIMSPVSDGEGLWSKKDIPSEANTWYGQNYSGFHADDVDAIHNAVPVEFDMEKRKAMLRRQQELWIAELPVLPLYFRNEATLIVNNLRNWQPTGTSTPVSWNCMKWYLEK